MTIEVDPAVARGIAGRLSTEANELFDLEGKVRQLKGEAVLETHGATALTELHEAHPELTSLANLMRLWADRLETTDVNLARQLDKQIAAAFGAFYANVVHDRVTDPSLAAPLPGESNEDYLARITAATTELRLRQRNLLKGTTTPYYNEWLLNAARNGVHSDQVIKIADELGITPSSFTVLNSNWRVRDNDGKSYFIISHPVGLPPLPADVQQVVLLTYILNAGTGYGSAAGNANNDFREVPYSIGEARRIAERIEKNSWTYKGGGLLPDLHRIWLSGGTVAATPNGMLVAVPGQIDPPSLTPLDRMVKHGGTTYGDLFILPIESLDSTQDLKSFIESGHIGVNSLLDSDRLLHHEEIHSQQWAIYGRFGFPATYSMGEQVAKTEDGHNVYEVQAGLHDGGYLP